MSILNLLTNITPEKAYFLGGLLVANEFYFNEGQNIWSVPIRHNPGQVSQHDIKQHFDFLKIMSNDVGGKIFDSSVLGSNLGFSAGKKGFAILFQSSKYENLNVVLDNFQIIQNSDKNIKRAFLIGAFDGRSSFDRDTVTGNIRNIAVDCDDKKVHDIISALLLEFGIAALSQNESRERLSGGRPRKNQLRIPKSGLANFAINIGFISPFRFKIFRQYFSQDLPFIYNEDDILPGLKTLNSKLSNTFYEENRLDEIVIEETNNKSIIPTISQYAGVPKPKISPSFTNGRKIYNRNPQIAINALALANYQCEIDAAHPTFIRRKNDKPYTEPHHLVPMAFSDRFDVSLDVEENIVSLCSHCHNLLHYGKDAKDLLALLLDKRKHLLKKVGINVDIDDLYEMYKLY